MDNYELLEDIKFFYHQQLKKCIKDNDVKLFREYDISDELVDKYKIGLSLIESNLDQYLLEKGYTKEEILSLPLYVGCESKLADVSNGMIMIPVNNLKGQCCGFLGVKETDDEKLLTKKFDCSKDYTLLGLDYYSELSQVIYLCKNPLSALKKNDKGETVYCFLNDVLLCCKEVALIQSLGIKHFALQLSNDECFLTDIANVLRILDYGFDVTVFNE